MKHKLSNINKSVAIGIVIHLYNMGWSRDDASIVANMGHARAQKIISEMGDKERHRIAKQSVASRRANLKGFAKAHRNQYVEINGTKKKLTAHTLQLLGLMERFKQNYKPTKEIWELFKEGSP